MDDLERASLASDNLTRDGIAKARRALTDGVSAETCQWCGDEIPDARRRAVPGCRLCVACQAIAEAR